MATIELIVLLFAFVVVRFLHGESNCVINNNPRTMVVLKNDTAFLCCDVDTQSGNNIYILFNRKVTSISVNVTEYMNRGITWKAYENGVKTAFNISVLATEENNGLIIQCGFAGCLTEEAEVIVVDAPPVAPNPPVITLINATAMSVSWSAPWMHPIQSYTLLISSNSFENTVNTSSTNYVLNKRNITECEVLNFTVRANTEIGSSEFSSKTFKGFPTDFKQVILSNLSISVQQTNCSSTSTLIAVGEIPDVCDYDDLQISFSVRDGSSGKSLPVSVCNNSMPCAFFQATDSASNSINVSQITTNEVGQIVMSTSFINISDLGKALHGDEVTQHPRTTVGLINSTVNFTCYDEDTGEHPISLQINQEKVTSLSQEDQEQLHDRGIQWQSLYNQNKEIGYDISISATVENNDTTIQCFFSPCFSEKAKLIVVKSPPGTQDPPVVNVINDNSLHISWTPPWFQPVNTYTLFIRNIDRGTTVTYKTSQIHYIIEKDNSSDCEVLKFSVAADTDVGTTKQSNETMKGFIKGLQNKDFSNLSRSYNFSNYSSDGIPESMNLYVQPLEICDYEILTYQFTVINNLSKETRSNTSHYSSASVLLNGTVLPGDSLTVLLKITNEANEQVNFTVFEKITFTLQITTSSQSDIISFLSSSPLLMPNITANQKEVFTEPVIIAISVSGVCIVTFIPGTLIIASLFFFRSNQVKRIREQPRAGTDQIDFTLPRMIANDNYANPQELYETIPTLKNLKEEKECCSPQSPTTPGSDAPLLPPRNTSSLPLNCRRNLEPITLKEDEYIEMTGNITRYSQKIPTSPRYTEAPTFSPQLQEIQETTNAQSNSVSSGIHKML